MLSTSKVMMISLGGDGGGGTPPWCPRRGCSVEKSTTCITETYTWANVPHKLAKSHKSPGLQQPWEKNDVRKTLGGWYPPPPLSYGGLILTNPQYMNLSKSI